MTKHDRIRANAADLLLALHDARCAELAAFKVHAATKARREALEHELRNLTAPEVGK